MSKVFKNQHNQNFQATMNQYFNSVLLDFDNVKEINAIMTAFEKKENDNKPKQRKNK